MNQRVAVVDDDDAMRMAMLDSLSSVGIEAEGFASATIFLQQIVDKPFSCVVMDVRMPGLSGLEALRRMREAGNATPVIFVTGHGDIDMAVAAMKLGAVDFLQKPYREQILIDNVQQVLARTVTPNDSARVTVLREQLALLTPREREVLMGVAEGLRSKQIAFNMSISQKTVDEYRHRIFEKMQVRSATALTALATEMRLSGLL